MCGIEKAGRDNTADDGLLKSSETHDNGVTWNVKTKNVIKHDQASKHPVKSQETRIGLDALTYLTRQGIPLIGAYPSGAMIAKQQPEHFTADAREIAALTEGAGDRQGRAQGSRIVRFYFIPKDAGLLCLDIDRKPGKRDGLQELYNLFPPDTLPRALQDIEQYFPCYVSTPSGGYHLYFKYTGELIRKTDLCPEVEIKHGRPGLTAPGSRKDNGAYILHGNLADAPPVYGIILDRITELQKQKSSRTASSWMPRRPIYRHDTPRITLDVLADEACAKYGGHHDRQVSFAGKAYRCRVSLTDALAYVTAHPDIFGTDPDTEITIRDIYHRNGAIY